MGKKIILGVMILGILAYSGYCYLIDRTPREIFDPLNTIYVLDGEAITLIDGREEKEVIPESAIKSITIAWNKVVRADLNNDGAADAALVLMHNSGGSGTFFYVVAALNGKTGKAVGTNAVFLGDRIFMENISVSGGLIIVDYLDRGRGEPMVAEPIIKVKRSFAVKEGVLKKLENY